MKIKLAKLSSNPWRDPDRYSFDEARLEALRTSIRATGFWDNLLARPDGSDGYQIAYGHHRLAVAKEELGEDYEADIPTRDLSDADMLKIMVQENETLYPHEIGVLKENILATKKFFATENGKRIYSEIKDKIGGGDTPKHPERKIYAEFLAIPENRVRTGLGIMGADNERLEVALSGMERPAGTHAQLIIEGVGDDKKTAADLAEIVKDQDFSTRQTRVVVNILRHTDEEDRGRILVKVKERPERVTPEDAVEKAYREIFVSKNPVIQNPDRTKQDGGLKHMAESLMRGKNFQLDANETLDGYAQQLRMMNVGLIDLVALWPELKPATRRRFEGAVTALFKTLTENSDLLKKGK